MSTPRRKAIGKALSNRVWGEHFPGSSGRCYVCNIPLEYKDFECGHVRSVANGGENTLANLKPVCGSCNKSVGRENMHDYMRRCGIPIPGEYDKSGQELKAMILRNEIPGITVWVKKSNNVITNTYMK